MIDGEAVFKGRQGGSYPATTTTMSVPHVVRRMLNAPSRRISAAARRLENPYGRRRRRAAHRRDVAVGRARRAAAQQALPRHRLNITLFSRVELSERPELAVSGMIASSNAGARPDIEIPAGKVRCDAKRTLSGGHNIRTGAFENCQSASWLNGEE